MPLGPKSWFLIYGEHLSGKPGNANDFDICQGSFMEKSFQGKVAKNVIVSSIFAFIWVFGNIQLVVYDNYEVLFHILIIDYNTSTGT